MLNLQAKGLQEVIDKFDRLAKDTQDQVQVALNEFGNRVVKDAKTTVSDKSGDTGLLQQKISSTPGNGDVTIVADTKYAAYIEFGTRKFAAEYVSSLPPDWQAFASTFKGKSNSGNYYDFLNAILDWVIRKGITARYSVKTKKRLKNTKEDDERLLAAASAIAFSIIKNGIKPKPFLYPAIQKNIPILEDDIKDIFE